MKSFGSLSYELREAAVNLACLPWLLVCAFLAALFGEFSHQRRA